MRSRFEIAWVKFGFALIAATVSGCSVYDPDLLSPKGASHQGSDGGAAGADSPPTTCDVDHDSTACTRAHADGVCLGGECTIVRCHEGYSDCDKLSENGCEATLMTSDNCGACGAHCSLQNVTDYLCEMAAKGAQCAIDRGCREGDTDCVVDSFGNGCDEGFADCDMDPANGCETSLHTLSNCGACGKTCSLDVAQASCDSGECEFVSCAAGFGDCGGVGCQSLTEDKHNCGDCGHECPADAPMCYGGRCTPLKCETATADCDGQAANKCEADLNSIENCGDCSTKCGPYDHATSVCDAKQCSISDCDDGFIDCDDVRDNGCETDAEALESCGVCGHDCSALAHVTIAECDKGQCNALDCEDNWGDCDGDPDNGCEQPLNTADDCEKCDQKCETVHGAASCETGKCVLSSCEEGFDDCNGDAGDGCEAALDSDDSCGKCGTTCDAGKSCKNGGCSCKDDSGCSDGATCCNGACIFTNSTCFPWPCIPGTTADKNNCGSCGGACLTWCCF